MARKSSKKLKKLPKKMAPTTGKGDFHQVNERAKENREKHRRDKVQASSPKTARKAPARQTQTTARTARKPASSPRKPVASKVQRRPAASTVKKAPVQVSKRDVARERSAARRAGGVQASRKIRATASQTRGTGRQQVGSRRGEVISGRRRVAVVGACALVAVGIAISPAIDTVKANGRLTSAREELKEQKAVTESLKGQIDEAKSLDYVKAEARRQRKVDPGEILYIVSSAESGNSEVEYRVRSIRSMEEARERVEGMLRSHPTGRY